MRNRCHQTPDLGISGDGGEIVATERNMTGNVVAETVDTRDPRTTPGRKPLRMACFLLTLILGVPALVSAQGSTFVRGDVDTDGVLNIVDPIGVLSYISGSLSLPCLDAVDVNDDGAVNIVDAAHLFHYLFLSGADPAPPFPTCGPDQVADTLGCDLYPLCP